MRDGLFSNGRITNSIGEWNGIIQSVTSVSMSIAEFITEFCITTIFKLLHLFYKVKVILKH